MDRKVQTKNRVEEHGCYFSDGKRKADYVLIYKENATEIDKTKETNSFINYVACLERFGLEMEVTRRQGMDILFILVHIPQSDLNDYSKIFGIGLEVPIGKSKSMGGCLGWMKPQVNAPFKKPGEFTSCDRIMVIQKLLDRARYGTAPEEVGIQGLIKQNAIEDAYPLHDGSATEPSETVRQNDRRLLYLHWANFGCWYKEIPLDLVQRYFGCEIAFYFAWVEFFNLMLLPPSIIGLLVLFCNIIIVNATDIPEIKQMCDADDMLICPSCSFRRYCVYKKVSRFCFSAKLGFIFDNYLTVFFAIFMSFWATLFLNLWKRKQNTLKMNWGIPCVDSEESEVRHEYIDELRKRNREKKQNGLEPFLPRLVTCSHVVATISFCIFLLMLVILAVMGVTIYKIIIRAETGVSKSEFFQSHPRMTSTITGSILQVIFIKIFGLMYGDLSIWLTKYENPRTKRDFDNSVLYKRYFLAFVNNYSPLFYIAFLKGRFYRIPYRHDILSVIQTDSCQPTNCILALSIQMGFLMVLKKFVGNILSLIIINVKTKFRKVRKEEGSDVPIYEADYALLPTNRYLLMTEFCEMIIEFGFVTFFVAAFPLAPLCAFLNNMLEHRLDATKLVTKYRRPVPRKVAGIGAWDGVMLGVTYLSTVTNAFVIAFTSDFVWREVYKHAYKSDLDGYINSTLSAYAPKDNSYFNGIPPEPKVCYYADKRYPPDHSLKYERTFDHWVDLTYRLICVFVFEHVILVLNGVLSYAIPDLPKYVKEHLNMERHLAKQAKLRVARRTIHKVEKKVDLDEVTSWIMV